MTRNPRISRRLELLLLTLGTALAGGLVALSAAFGSSDPDVPQRFSKPTIARLSGAAASKRFTLTATSHRPKSGRRWTATVRGPRASVSLHVLYAGAVVGHMASGSIRGGSYSHTVRWPRRAIGHPLVVQATVSHGARKTKLKYRVRVR